MKKLTVNVVSESAISVRGHGVHTAFLEMVRSFKTHPEIQLRVNAFSLQSGSDITHIHTVGIRALKLLWFARGKKVVSAHVIPASLLGSLRLAKYWLPIARYYLKWFYKKADAIVAVSRTVADTLIDDMKVPASKVHVIYNNIDITLYKRSPRRKKDARKRLELSATAHIIVGVGQVQPRKRLDTFIACAHALPQMQFIWVGGMPFKQLGADYAKMQKMIQHVPDNMIVTGLKEHDEVRHYLHAADVFMLPAEQENHPMAVIEAAASGLPIVLRDIPEYHDTFKDDALLCVTTEDFVTALKKLLQYKSLREVFIKKADKIAQRFDSSHTAQQYIDLYHTVIKGNNL
jgi:1,2-diacylglycerol-3-alpha-glucose alpha-1,2-galactosyltransferase